MTTIPSSSSPSAPPRRPRGPTVLGIVAGLVLYLGASAFGDTPDPGESAATIDAYFLANRTSFFVGVVVVGAGAMLLLAVVARIGTQLDGVGQRTAARLAQSAATVAAAALVLGMLLPYVALSYVIARDEPSLGKGLFELTIVVVPLLALPLATLLGAVAVGLLRSRTGRRWFAVASLAAAALLLVGACSFQVDGFLSPDVQQQVVFGVLTLWLLASGPGTGGTGAGERTVAGRVALPPEADTTESAGPQDTRG